MRLLNFYGVVLIYLVRNVYLIDGYVYKKKQFIPIAVSSTLMYISFYMKFASHKTFKKLSASLLPVVADSLMLHVSLCYVCYII